MIEADIYITFLVACIAIIIIPGPTVTVIIANSIRSGAKAGIANVAGTQLGLALTMLVLAFGLPVVIAIVGEAFIWLKLVGAAYLVWLGIGLWRNRDSFSGIESIAEKTTFKRMFMQGFFVILTNPKSLLFFGVFIPQFIDPGRNAVWQTLIFGGTFMIVATVLDGAYALLAGGAGRMLTKTRIRVLERMSGTLLISGGIWLALQKRS